ncbi:hypothetical protein BKA62DRAFT_202019 [Auriculariales sp. MPI-PUGE-AT-0066]|nr:hypothetical protein BKA62DRAFT_202019 [Auriculariales sp. MPI-PUGE-AT-0066]
MSKRARHAPSPSASLSHSESEEEAGPSRTKAPRSNNAQLQAPLLCSLPPTCCPPHGTPTPLADTRELEAHYARAHAHVCAERGCGKVFPDARLLQLHHTENHDSLAGLRKERGEKIFACHVIACPKICATPKSRRLHLIEAHGYPKQYFFAVTNKGIGGLLARWGEGATMLRGEWKPRDAQEPAMVDKQSFRDPGKMQVDGPASEDGDDTDSAAAPSNTPSQRKAERTVRFVSPTSPVRMSSPPPPEEKPGLGDGVDALVRELGDMSVALVPRGVRFGRGAARGGFTRGGRGRGGGAPPASALASVQGQDKILASPNSTMSAASAAPAAVSDAMEEDHLNNHETEAQGDTPEGEEKKKTRRTNRGGRGRSRNKNKNGAAATSATGDAIQDS